MPLSVGNNVALNMAVSMVEYKLGLHLCQQSYTVHELKAELRL
jgi:hypothetical protein